jgi:hypothetical protein
MLLRGKKVAEKRKTPAKFGRTKEQSRSGHEKDAEASENQ